MLLVSGTAADLGLSVFVWEAVCLSGVANRRYFLAMFDMNRWYNAQMPSCIRCVPSFSHTACERCYHRNLCVSLSATMTTVLLVVISSNCNHSANGNSMSSSSSRLE